MAKIRKQTLKRFSNSGFTLIEVLVVIGMIAILASVVLVAINPARQFRQGRDLQRSSNINAILSAVGQYTADHKGTVPAAITTDKKNISNSGANLCADLVPTYLAALPVDPNVEGGPLATCPSSYDTGYRVMRDSMTGRITVTANGEEPAGTDNITITR